MQLRIGQLSHRSSVILKKVSVGHTQVFKYSMEKVNLVKGFALYRGIEAGI
jgi:hypothetical protein